MTTHVNLFLKKINKFQYEHQNQNEKQNPNIQHRKTDTMI